MRGELENGIDDSTANGRTCQTRPCKIDVQEDEMDRLTSSETDTASSRICHGIAKVAEATLLGSLSRGGLLDDHGLGRRRCLDGCPIVPGLLIVRRRNVVHGRRGW